MPAIKKSTDFVIIILVNKVNFVLLLTFCCRKVLYTMRLCYKKKNKGDINFKKKTSLDTRELRNPVGKKYK